MAVDLRPCEAKLERAREHRRVLSSELEAFFTDSALGHRVSFDEQDSVFRIHALLDDDRAYRWATILGDIVHNLRSTLDHLVNQLVLANSEEPRSSNQFPICDQESSWEREIGKKERLTGVATEDVDLIRHVQPFAWAARYTGTTRARIQALAQLRDLSNHDKHKLLLPIRLFPRELRYALDMEDAERVDPEDADDEWGTEAIADGGVILEVRVRKTGPRPDWEPHLQIGGYLAIDAQGLPAHDKPVMDIVGMLEGVVEQTIDLFRGPDRQSVLA
jgi:hypothetical protein